MIEALIAHIEDQGFEVRVLPGLLRIYTTVNDRHWSIDWALSSLDLQYFRESGLDFWIGEADQRLAQLRKAIEDSAALQAYRRVEQRYSEANRRLAEGEQ